MELWKNEHKKPSKAHAGSYYVFSQVHLNVHTLNYSSQRKITKILLHTIKINNNLRNQNQNKY